MASELPEQIHLITPHVLKKCVPWSEAMLCEILVNKTSLVHG